MGFRRRTRRRALVAGAVAGGAIAHHERKKAAEEEQAYDQAPAEEQALPLIGSALRRHFLDGVDLDQYSRTVLQPIREIILRGGKAWRSYGVLACMDLVGGDSQPFAHWPVPGSGSPTG